MKIILNTLLLLLQIVRTTRPAGQIETAVDDVGIEVQVVSFSLECPQGSTDSPNEKNDFEARLGGYLSTLPQESSVSQADAVNIVPVLAREILLSLKERNIDKINVLIAFTEKYKDRIGSVRLSKEDFREVSRCFRETAAFLLSNEVSAELLDKVVDFFEERRPEESTHFDGELSIIRRFKKGIQYKPIDQSGIAIQCSELDLSYMSISRENADLVAGILIQIPHLVSLKLSNIKFNKETATRIVSAIRELTELTELDVSWCGFQKISIDTLSSTFNSLKGLKSLNLSYTDLDKGYYEMIVEAIQHMPDLETFDMSGRFINTDTFKKLILALSGLTKFKSLNLSEITSSFSDRCGIDLVNMLMRLPHLTSLSLRANKIKFENTEKFNQDFPNLNLLDLSECRLSECDISSLSKVIEKLPSLQTLNVSSNSLKCEGIKKTLESILKNNSSNFTSLDISKNKLSRADLETIFGSLKEFSKLKELRLRGNEFGSKETSAILLEEWSSLELLDVSRCDLDENDMFSLLSGLNKVPKLKTLTIKGNKIGSEITDELLEPLKEHKHESLTTLDLSHISPYSGEFPTEFYQVLKIFPNLTSLDISNSRIEDTKALSDALQGLPKLENIDLSFNRIGGNGVISIIRVLKEKCPNLSSLDLLFNEINTEALEKILELLNQLPNFKSLDLRGNNINYEEISEGAQQLLRTGMQFRVIRQ